MSDGLTSDHDMIVSMFTTLNRIDKTLFGNGQPGLLSEHTSLKQEVKEVRTDMEKFVTEKVDEVRATTPSKGTARWGAFAGVAAFVGMVIGNVIVVLRSS